MTLSATHSRSLSMVILRIIPFAPPIVISTNYTVA